MEKKTEIVALYTEIYQKKKKNSYYITQGNSINWYHFSSGGKVDIHDSWNKLGHVHMYPDIF